MSDPFTAEELDCAVKSIHNVAEKGWEDTQNLLREFYAGHAHLNYKEWENTEQAALTFATIVGSPADQSFQHMFKRVLVDGNWAAAAKAKPIGDSKPWVVLMTGTNGIRKTTSVYQTWWKTALKEALGDSYSGEENSLPSGQNSFFRQLDYMLVTLSNEGFKQLYEEKDLKAYSNQKARLFSRYRMLAETLGILLLKSASKEGLNLMVETSGRDIGMYKYIDFLFPGDKYNKLVVNMTINDLSHAEKSVDRRMQNEMKRGQAALKAGAIATEIVAVNAGGPYGSEVLAGVQAASKSLWEKMKRGECSPVGDDWKKASLEVEASDSEPWGVFAVRPDGSKSAKFQFAPLA